MKTAKPGKQRKKLYRAPQHERHKRFSSPLSSELKASHNTGSIPVRTGDTVRIMRGDYKGFEGKITKVDRKNYRVFVEGITREKVDGTAIPVPIHPSKIMINRLDLGDEWRKEALKRKGVGKKAEPPEERKPKRSAGQQRKREREGGKASTKSGGA